MPWRKFLLKKGLVPTITKAIGTGLGAYGGYMLGTKLDNNYGINSTLGLTIGGGLLGRYGSNKLLLTVGSKGYLPRTTNAMLYGSNFNNQIVSNLLKNRVNLGVDQKLFNQMRISDSMDQLWNFHKRPYAVSALDPDYIPHTLGDDILSPRQLQLDYPNAFEDPKWPNQLWNIGDGRRNPHTPIYTYRDANHHIIQIDDKKYFTGNRTRNPFNSQATLVHQGDVPIYNGVMTPKKTFVPGNPDEIWWELNHPAYPHTPSSAFVINDIIPKHKDAMWGDAETFKTFAVDLKNPELNFKFFTKDPISGELVKSPFVFEFPKKTWIPYLGPKYPTLPIVFRKGGKLKNEK